MLQVVTRGRSGSKRSRRIRCTVCSAAVVRVHRDGLDRWLSRFRPAHRYRCSDPGCGWEGRLAAGPSTSRLTRALGPLPLSTWLMIGAVLVLAAVDGTHRYLKAEAAERERLAIQRAAAEAGTDATASGFPAGWHFAGNPLPAQDPRARANPSQLTLLRGCVWGSPGRDPYRGSTEQALKAARLPPEVVHEVSALIASGAASAHLEISNDGIRTLDGRREFSPKVPAMAFGQSLCFDTVVNFQPGHVEPARLFEASARDGRLFSVMVPSVCGNVSVLSERPVASDDPGPDDQGQVLAERAELPDTPAGVRAATAPASASDGGPGGRRLARTSANHPPGGGGTGTRKVGGAATNTVPEPGTIAMVPLALAVMAWTMRRRRRQPRLKKSRRAP
jgi:hypothetical protein